jgi:hypothetical protein
MKFPCQQAWANRSLISRSERGEVKEKEMSEMIAALNARECKLLESAILTRMRRNTRRALHAIHSRNPASISCDPADHLEVPLNLVRKRLEAIAPELVQEEA